MKFYHRHHEIETLSLLYQQAMTTAKMVVITGRRRIGKTLLATTYAEDKPHLYLFVSKKSETLLCQEFVKRIKQTFDTPIIGELNTLQAVFTQLFEIAKSTPFVLIVDEFQEFMNINPSIYSDLQELWDRNKSSAKLQVLFLGSVYSLMHQIFESSKEPLFGRADRIIKLRAFTPKEMLMILSEHTQGSNEALFSYYLFTGGVPKYIDVLLTHKLFTENAIVDFILTDDSPFINEGKNVLIEEFGKDYGIYFSILELMSVGKNTRAEIESILQKNTGGYLERLENDYAVIQKFKPINAKPNAKLQRYQLRDRFLQFWFRFIYRHRTAIESRNFDYIKQILDREFREFKGRLLEQFYFDVFAQSKQFNKIGCYWEKDGLNEIDLVAINDLQKRLLVADIKLKQNKIDINILKAKSVNLLKSYPGYHVKYIGLCLDNIDRYLDTEADDFF